MIIFLIFMDEFVQRNYLNLLSKEMDIVYILNIRFKKMIVLCKILFMYNLFDKFVGIDFRYAVLNLYYQRFSERYQLYNYTNN